MLDPEFLFNIIPESVTEEEEEVVVVFPADNTLVVALELLLIVFVAMAPFNPMVKSVLDPTVTVTFSDPGDDPELLLLLFPDGLAALLMLRARICLRCICLLRSAKFNGFFFI